AEVFESMKERRAILYVEMKCAPSESSALAAEVARLVRAHSLIDSLVVESFTLKSIAEIKRFAPEIRTAALFEPRLSCPLPSARKLVEQALRYSADEIALHRTLATRRVVEAAQKRGLKTVVWTVDNPAWVKRGRDFGIQAIITNRPAQMRARLNELLNA
ncbi:MAG TPA: glycerophosphodiester phosphodiesterase, partial [Pyrinomonadaceae bacterium]|nr:glycerophosphodiester phosphodiesterase [Pyrinomonadaceae bacterium]